MIDVETCASIHRNEETRDQDFKGPMSWDEKDKQAYCALTMDILAMANTAGGTIAIGVAENEQGAEFAGLEPEQADSWETTRLNNFVNSYTDPPVNCTLRKVGCDRRLYVVIRVPPFSFTAMSQSRITCQL